MKKQFLLMLVCISIFYVKAQAQSDFITCWQLPVGQTTLTFNAERATGGVAYTWTTVPAGTSGSGTFAVGNGGVTVAGLPAGATIRLNMSHKNLEKFYINGGVDKDNLFDVEQWGIASWKSMSEAFEGCTNLNISATDVPNLSYVTDMLYMFAGCTSLNSPSNINTWDVSHVTNMYGLFGNASSFNQPIGNWDVSNVTNMESMFQNSTSFNQSLDAWNTANVTNMSYMFKNASSFNESIGNWNTGNVINMSYMFNDAILFNQPIGNWNVSQVTNMRYMFSGATFFNQPIGNWNTGNVINMLSTFYNASSFNQPIGNWNVSIVTNMGGMFSGATSFNQPLGNWDVSHVTNMGAMFYEASSFNQPIEDWDVSHVTNMLFMFYNAITFNQYLGTWVLNSNVMMSNMLSNCGMDCTNYSNTLIGWNANPLTPNGRNLGAAGRKYLSNAIPARTNLTTTKGWTITGDALGALVTTPAISGLTVPCALIQTTYSVSPVANATSYTWTVPPGATIVSGQGTTSITVNFAGTSLGDVTVTASNACSVGTTSSLSIETIKQGVPSQISTINGPNATCLNTLVVNYFLAFTGSAPSFTNYNWVVTGGTILSGQGTSSIQVSFNSIGSKTISVTPYNSCGNGVSTTKTVSVSNGVPYYTGTKGNIAYIQGPSKPCINNPVTYNIQNLSLILGATSYVWTVPTGCSIVSGQGTSSISVIFNNSLPGLGGQIKVTPTNNCGAAAPLGKSITPIYCLPQKGFEKSILENKEIKLYPNPAKTTITIDGIKQGNTIEIYDLQGKLLFTKDAENTNEIIDISQYANGIYLAKIINKNQEVKTVKFVVER